MLESVNNPMRLFSTLLLAGVLGAQTNPDLGQNFDKTEVMIPMRDGVKLHTEIYAPKNAAEKLPFLIHRTPYGPGQDPQGFRLTPQRYLCGVGARGLYLCVSGYPWA